MIDPELMTPDERRFWALVDIQYGPDGTLDFEKCWPWKGARSRPSTRHTKHPGYGRFRLLTHRKDCRKGVKTHVRAHRHAWELWHGETMPAELDAAHVECDNPPCCNPTHVGPQEHTENWRSFTDRYGNGQGKRKSLEGNDG
jgi:hypothetical protein